MKMTIEVDRVRFHAHHGVGDQERIVGNDFEVSVSVEYPPALEAAETDSLDDTMNYAELIAVISRVMAEPSLLLEHVAGRMRKAILQRFPQVKSGRIRVAKLLPPVEHLQLGETAVVLVW